MIYEQFQNKTRSKPFDNYLLEHDGMRISMIITQDRVNRSLTLFLDQYLEGWSE